MNGTRRTLLIVEDDPSLQKQMQWAFDSYETVVASDRDSAIAQLRRYEPAVVTMDSHGRSLHQEVSDVSKGRLQGVLA